MDIEIANKAAVSYEQHNFAELTDWRRYQHDDHENADWLRK